MNSLNKSPNWKRIVNVALICSFIRSFVHSLIFFCVLNHFSKATLSRCCSRLGSDVNTPQLFHFCIESHFINQQTSTIRKTSSNKLMLHGFFPVLDCCMCFFFCCTFALIAVRFITGKLSRMGQKNNDESGKTRKKECKPIVKFPCGTFIADNQQILIPKTEKRNTYLDSIYTAELCHFTVGFECHNSSTHCIPNKTILFWFSFFSVYILSVWIL